MYVWRSVWRCKVDCSMYGVLCGDVGGLPYVWRSAWSCKLDCSMYGVLCGDVSWTAVCMSFCVKM